MTTGQPESNSHATPTLTLRMTNLQLRVEEPESELPRRMAARLGVGEEDLQSWRILRKSLDARKRHELKFVYSLALELPTEVAKSCSQRLGNDVGEFHENPFYDPPPGTGPLAERRSSSGTGPAGLLAGYYLAKKGYRPCH